MKLAIMQPYFFPYIGYFQLIHAVDTFVIFDDVNFIKGGWINRNNILSQGKKSLLTLQLLGASQNVFINEIKVGNNREKLLKSILYNYRKAPQFELVFPFLEKLVLNTETNASAFISCAIKEVSSFLGISPNWVLSSEIEKETHLKGQDKILSICEKLGAKQYFNLPGGKGLYKESDFSQKGIKLSFIAPGNIEYKQFNNEFIPNLSIIDIIMFNSTTHCSELLQEYTVD